MLESCFCGRQRVGGPGAGLDAKARWLLRCPSCGHLDDLAWLGEDTALLIWGEAVDRRGGASEAA